MSDKPLVDKRAFICLGCNGAGSQPYYDHARDCDGSCQNCPEVYRAPCEYCGGLGYDKEAYEKACLEASIEKVVLGDS